MSILARNTIILNTPSLVESSTWGNPGNIHISGSYATCTLSRRTTSGTLTIEYDNLSKYKIKEIYVRVRGMSSRSSCTVTIKDENNVTLASSLQLSVNSSSIIKSSNLADKINQNKLTINLTVYNGSYYSSNISIDTVDLEIVAEETIGGQPSDIINSKNVYLGDIPISELYLGNSSISELYLGDNLIYKVSKDVITDGLIYYVDARDYTQGNYEWIPKVGNEVMDLSYLYLYNTPPTKVGNCLKIPSGPTAACFFNPFSNKTFNFTLELYIKDLTETQYYSNHLLSLSKQMSVGIFIFHYYEQARNYIVLSLLNDNGDVSVNYEIDPKSPIHIQIACSNGNLNIYINGNLLKTANNFSLHLSVTDGKDIALLLGPEIASSPLSPAYASVRFYNRGLSKDELDKNRKLDLSIY